MRQNNKGFTLIELIIAMAISVVVLGCASMLLGSAQKSYRVAEETINLQKESQILMERLAGFIMESNKVSVEGSNVLVLSTVSRNQGRTDLPSTAVVPNPKTTVIWQKGTKLYIVEYTKTPDQVSTTPAILDALAIEDNCISEYIEMFMPTYDSSKPQQLNVSLLMKQGTRAYTLTDDIMIRNEII